MKQTLILACLLWLCASNGVQGAKIYMSYDPSSMDRLQYLENDHAKESSFLCYQLRINPRERLVMELSQEPDKVVASIETAPKAWNALLEDDYFAEKVMNQTDELYLVFFENNQYRIASVKKLYTWFRIEDVIGSTNAEYEFTYYRNADPGVDLATEGSRSMVYFLETSNLDCMKSFRFKKVSKQEGGQEFMDFSMVPDIGLYKCRIGFTNDDADKHTIKLTHINYIPFGDYLRGFCEKKDLAAMAKSYMPKPVIPEPAKTVVASRSAEKVVPTAYEMPSATKKEQPQSPQPNTNITPADYQVIEKAYKTVNEIGAEGVAFKHEGERSNVSITSGAELASRGAPLEKTVSTPATAAVVSPCGPSSTPGIHTVQKGESLYAIGRKYSVSVETLRRLNNLAPNAILQPCDNLYVTETAVRPKASEALQSRGAAPETETAAVPESYEKKVALPKWKTNASGVHVVQEGETVEQLAQWYGYTELRFRMMNGLGSDEAISSGQQLKTYECPCPCAQQKVQPAEQPRSEVPAGAVPTEYNVKSVLGSNKIMSRSAATEPAEKQVSEKGIPATAAKKTVKYHIVEEEETLISIAKKYGMTVEKLRQLNKLEDKEIILPYQKLVVE